MIGREFRFHNGKKGAALAIRLVDGGQQDRISKVLNDGTLVINIAGNPDQPGNALLKFLAKELGLDIDNLDIVDGIQGADLLLSILDITPEVLQDRIMEKIT